MDRSGQIINAAIVRSAGHPMLDQAALAAARPGSSLPSAPASLPQQQFTFSVPLRFNLR
jgi:protein TonB